MAGLTATRTGGRQGGEASAGSFRHKAVAAGSGARPEAGAPDGWPLFSSRGRKEATCYSEGDGTEWEVAASQGEETPGRCFRCSSRAASAAVRVG